MSEDWFFKRVELSLSPAEALRVLELLDMDHDCNENPLSKSAAKKVWRHLIDAGVLTRDQKRRAK